MARSQSDYGNRFALGANYYALTYHPGGGGAEYPRQFDDKAYWVLQVGGEGYADYYVKPWFLVRGAGSLYKDCADVWAGFAHLGFRLNWAPAERLAFRIGIGPSFLWRQSWLGKVKNYRSDAFFGRPDPGAKFQSAWIWYGGNLEAEYKLRPHLGLLYSLVPGYPFVITSSLGLRAGF
ncbi:MAG: hypothetical protein JWO30_337 [Fibrobacteres bacterium]|nr:hypothetical protein [Fibrobacterota bacterium]